MSDVDENDSDDTAEHDSAPKVLRDQNKKLAKQVEDLLSELSGFKAEKRTATIADVLRQKDANPKLAKHIARDLEGEVTEESVTQWLETEGDAFGYTPPGTDDTDEPEAAAAQAAIAKASADAPPSPTGWTPDRIKNATTEQLIEAGLLAPK